MKQGFSFGKVTIVFPWAPGSCRRYRPGWQGPGIQDSRQVMVGEGSASGAPMCFPGSPHIHSSGRRAALNGSGRNRPVCPGCAVAHGAL